MLFVIKHRSSGKFLAIVEAGDSLAARRKYYMTSGESYVTIKPMKRG